MTNTIRIRDMRNGVVDDGQDGYSPAMSVAGEMSSTASAAVNWEELEEANSLSKQLSAGLIINLEARRDKPIKSFKSLRENA